MLSKEHICRILGHLDNRKVERILALLPSIADVETAGICLAGDKDVMAKSAHHISGMSEAIVEIVCEKEITASP